MSSCGISGGELAGLGYRDAARWFGVCYDRPLNECLDAMLAATDLGWWWPYHEIAILTARPDELHRDGQGWLHRADGPAVVYPDGWTVHAWHGTRVPASLIAGTWSVRRILNEPNVEIRRCAIEHLGWDRFVLAAGLVQVGPTVPDPGNPGHTLALYDIPDSILPTRVRVLLCTNATVERDGTRRRFGLAVPAHIADPLEAAAWGYGLTAAQYAQAHRRT
jgi:hypothetical protein